MCLIVSSIWFSWFFNIFFFIHFVDAVSLPHEDNVCISFCICITTSTIDGDSQTYHIGEFGLIWPRSLYECRAGVDCVRVLTIKLFYFKFYNIHNIKYCACTILLLLGNHFILFLWFYCFITVGKFLSPNSLETDSLETLTFVTCIRITIKYTLRLNILV